MVATAGLDTEYVFTVKLAEFFPAGTTIVAGRLALSVLLANLITAPVGPAGPFKVTTPTEDLPPITEGGLKLRDKS